VIIAGSVIVSYCIGFVFWQKPLLVLSIFCVISVILLSALRSYKLVIVYMIGGILGALMESQSTVIGIWHYAIPEWRGVPWYLFLVWGNTTIFAISAFKNIVGDNEHLFVPNTFNGAWKQLVGTAIVTAIALGILWSLWQYIFLASMLLVVISGIYIAAQPRPSVMIKVYIATVCGGLITDLFGIPLGIWSYSVSTFAGIPLFMLFAWGLTGVIFVSIYNVLNVFKSMRT
jgi:hypothetical protein